MEDFSFNREGISVFFFSFANKITEMVSSHISIEQINKLDALAFRILYKEYYRALVVYAMQLIEEPQAAEDIVQELFSTIWERKRPFQSLGSLNNYLYNSVRNASLDYLKHKDVENVYLQKIENEYRKFDLNEEDEEDFFGEEVYRQLFQTIDALPERCREVFLLHMDGKKNEEIAVALHVSLETVKTQKKRAMAVLRKKMSIQALLLLL